MKEGEAYDNQRKQDFEVATSDGWLVNGTSVAGNRFVWSIMESQVKAVGVRGLRASRFVAP